MSVYARLSICAMFGVFVVVTAVCANTLDVEHVPYAPTTAQHDLVTRLASQPVTQFTAKVFVSRRLSALPTGDDGRIGRSRTQQIRRSRIPSVGDVPYRLLSPPPGTAHAPLVIVLHGSGQIGVDNLVQMGPFAKSWAEPEIATRFPAYVAVPQVPERSATYAPDVDGEPFAAAGPALKSVLELGHDLVKTLPVDRQRVYVVGFSMGASAALVALLAEPRCFAAAVAFSPVPPARRLASRAAHKPVMLVHGSLDAENPFAADRLWAQALTDAGGKPRFIVVDGMDHRVSPAMLIDPEWRTWLFAQHLDDR